LEFCISQKMYISLRWNFPTKVHVHVLDLVNTPNTFTFRTVHLTSLYIKDFIAIPLGINCIPKEPWHFLQKPCTNQTLKKNDEPEKCLASSSAKIGEQESKLTTSTVLAGRMTEFFHLRRHAAKVQGVCSRLAKATAAKISNATVLDHSKETVCPSGRTTTKTELSQRVHRNY
jgi:hypothetical protein